MDNALLLLGRLAGIIGTLLSLSAGLARLSGMHWFGSYESLTVLQGGMAGLLFGCFCLLLRIAGKP
jgi:hypothetical protein